MQEANDASFISQVVDVVLPTFVSLCCQKFSSNVIEQCLEFADRSGRARLVNEVLTGDTVQVGQDTARQGRIPQSGHSRK